MENLYNFKNNNKDSVAWWCFWPSLIFLGISLIISVIGGIGIGLFIGLSGNFKDATEMMQEVAKYVMPINIVVQIICTAIFLPIYLMTKKEAFPKVTKKCHWSVGIWSVLFLLGVSTVSAFIVDLISRVWTPSDGGLEAITEALFSGSLWATVITTVIMAPIMEELMIRGLTFNKLLSGSKKWTAIIVSSIIFGVIHLNLLQGLNAFVLGIILALVFYKTRSIIICMICHAANNLLSVIGSYLVLNEIGNYELTNNLLSIACIVLGIVGGYFFFKSKDAELKNNKEA